MSQIHCNESRGNAFSQDLRELKKSAVKYAGCGGGPRRAMEFPCGKCYVFYRKRLQAFVHLAINGTVSVFVNSMSSEAQELWGNVMKELLRRRDLDSTYT